MRTKRITFGEYDTKQLKEAKSILCKVFEFNYDSSRKEKLLSTVINKLDAIIEEYGEKDGLSNTESPD